MLVVAIDLRLSDEAPYPASVQDANYGVRWLKSRAAEWNGDASRLGIYGSSSGGHVAQLLALQLVQVAQRVEALAAQLAVHAGRIGGVEDRIALAAALDPLEYRR